MPAATALSRCSRDYSRGGDFRNYYCVVRHAQVFVVEKAREVLQCVAASSYVGTCRARRNSSTYARQGLSR
jgi:hypothetical protein